MTGDKYKPAMALREHMLEGHRLACLEAMLLFGVQSLSAELTRMKKNGFIIKSQRVPMADIIQRISQYTECNVPKTLPYREIQLIEYWISR
jgi:Helix-turn-helix domain